MALSLADRLYNACTDLNNASRDILSYYVSFSSSGYCTHKPASRDTAKDNRRLKVLKRAYKKTWRLYLENK